jgi:hypothetical protein
VAEKNHYYPTPCTTALWGEGEGGFYLYAYRFVNICDKYFMFHREKIKTLTLIHTAS